MRDLTEAAEAEEVGEEGMSGVDGNGPCGRALPDFTLILEVMP